MTAMRRRVWIGAAAGAVALLCVAAVALLARGWLAYRRAEAGLNGARAELERLYARNPFPSEENVKEEQRKEAALRRELAGLLARLAEGQTPEIEQSPARFMAQFWDTRQSLLNAARERGVSVPEDMAFGFGRYMTGNLPNSPDVMRLTQQLTIMQALVSSLFEARISALTGVGREEFEGEAAPETAAPVERRRGAAAGVAATSASALNTRNPQAGLIEGDALYGVWRFKIEFTGREAALLEALNRMAEHRLFVVVKTLRLDSSERGLDVGAEGGRAGGRDEAKTAAASADGSVARDERILTGRDLPLSARVELEVYQFRKSPPGQEDLLEEGA